MKLEEKSKPIGDVVSSILSDLLPQTEIRRAGRLAVPLWIVDDRPDLQKKILERMTPLPGADDLDCYRAPKAGMMYYWGESADFEVQYSPEPAIYHYELTYKKIGGVDFFNFRLVSR